MRSHFVVFPASGFDLFAGVIYALEPVLAETFHADDGVVALSIRVVGWLARSAEVERYALAVCPEIELLRGELAAPVLCLLKTGPFAAGVFG